MASALPWRPQIIAHRGGAGSWPEHRENSRDAFLTAAAACFGSECDVWPSSDGEPVVIHDSTLDRVTAMTGRVIEYHSTQLQRNANLSLLSGVSNLVELVEIKPRDAKQFVHRVIEIMRGRKWTLMSFDQANLFHATEFDPQVKVAYLVDDPKGIDTSIAGKWATYIKHELLEDRAMGRLRDAGLAVGTWTVDDEDALRRIVALRPDLVISDVPILIKRWLGNP